jgi:transposase-like protein
MDLSRAVYSRDLKIAVMRSLDAGAASGETARKYQLSPKLLERWRGEWRAKGELAFPGIGRRGVDLPAAEGQAVKALCQMTGLNRAGFYRSRTPRQATPVEMEMRDEMQKIAVVSPA